MLGGAVRGGTKALQKMTAQERLQDLHAASEDLETTAAGNDCWLSTIQQHAKHAVRPLIILYPLQSCCRLSVCLFGWLLPIGLHTFMHSFVLGPFLRSCVQCTQCLT